MDKVELYNRFEKFEIENNLNDIRDEYGNNVWELLRYYVYDEHISRLFDSEHEHLPVLNERRNLFFTRLMRLSSFLFSCLCSYVILLYYVICRKSVYLHLIAGRDIVLGEKCDRNQKSILELTKGNHLIINNGFYHSNKWINRAALGLLFRLITPRKKNKSVDEVIDKVNKAFNCKIDSNAIYKRYWNSIQEEKMYSFIFSVVRVRKIFLTMNGIQKGMIRVAKNHCIDVCEVQHAIIEIKHVNYNYPFIDDAERYLPTYFLLYTDYWKSRMQMPGVKFYTIGNDYTIMSSRSKKNDNCLGIMPGYNNDSLLYDLKDILNKGTWLNSIKVIIKLHPNDFGRKYNWVDMFKPFNNVTVVSDEIMAEDVLQKCMDIVFVNESTVIYQALDCGNHVFLYQMDNININDANIRYIETLSEVDSAKFEFSYSNAMGKYFMPFNADVVKNELL